MCRKEDAVTFEMCVVRTGGEDLNRWTDISYRSNFLCPFINQRNQSLIDKLDLVLTHSSYYEQIKIAIENFFIKCATSQFVWFKNMENEFNIGRLVVYLFLLTVGALMACICSKALLILSLQICIGEVSISLIMLFTNDIIIDNISTHLLCLIYRYIITIRFICFYWSYRPKFTLAQIWKRKVAAPRKRKAIDSLPDDATFEASPEVKQAPRRSTRLSRT